MFAMELVTTLHYLQIQIAYYFSAHTGICQTRHKQYAEKLFQTTNFHTHKVFTVFIVTKHC